MKNSTAEAVSFFREVQYRLAIIEDQFLLLLLGAGFLLFAVFAYPFTSTVLLGTLATGTLLTFVVGILACYLRLERDEHLSQVLGTTANKVDWDFGTVSFFTKNLLLGALVLIVQFVPGTWASLGKLLAPLSHLGH